MMRALACVVALLAAPAHADALRIVDDRGVALALERPAQRIVALAPHLAEIAFAAGAGAKLVGVSAYSNAPDEARRLPVVASYGRIDLERVIALRPDAVLAWQSGNPVLQVARLERLGIPAVVTEARRLEDIPRIIRLVGALAGTGALADVQARRFESAMRDLGERYASARPVPVFLEIWLRPMLTVNGEHLVSDALRICGGRNVFARAGFLTPVVSREQILGARPEAIVTTDPGGDAPQAWRGLDVVPAVRAHKIYPVDPDLLLGQGPRLAEGVRALCRQLELARK
jgi:iron complex transport system substrate-binding protein